MLAARFCFSSLHISGEQPKSARAADLQAAFRRVQFDVAQNAAVRVGDFRDAADAAQRLILAAVNTHAAAPQAAENSAILNRTQTTRRIREEESVSATLLGFYQKQA